MNITTEIIGFTLRSSNAITVSGGGSYFSRQSDSDVKLSELWKEMDGKSQQEKFELAKQFVDNNRWGFTLEVEI